MYVKVLNSEVMFSLRKYKCPHIFSFLIFLVTGLISPVGQVDGSYSPIGASSAVESVVDSRSVITVPNFPLVRSMPDAAPSVLFRMGTDRVAETSGDPGERISLGALAVSVDARLSPKLGRRNRGNLGGRRGARRGGLSGSDRAVVGDPEEIPARVRESRLRQKPRATKKFDQ